MAYDTDELGAAYGNPLLMAQGARSRALRAAGPPPPMERPHYRSGDPLNMGFPGGMGRLSIPLALGGAGVAAALPVIRTLKERPQKIEEQVRRAEEASNEEQR